VGSGLNKDGQGVRPICLGYSPMLVRAIARYTYWHKSSRTLAGTVTNFHTRCIIVLLVTVPDGVRELLELGCTSTYIGASTAAVQVPWIISATNSMHLLGIFLRVISRILLTTNNRRLSWSHSTGGLSKTPSRWKAQGNVCFSFFGPCALWRLLVLCLGELWILEEEVLLEHRVL